MEYYITSWTSSGQITGTGSTPDGTIPSGAIPCTEAQAKTPSAYIVDISTTPPTVVDAPTSVLLAQAQASQIALLQTSAQQAEQAPVSIALASGVTASFGMTPHDWTKIVGLYAKYVAKGVAVPSGYTIPDITGKAQVVTATDLENLMNAGEAQIQATIAKAATLIGQIEAATSVQEVTALGW